MPARFIYRRLKAAELRAELNRQNLDILAFCRIFGVRAPTGRKWVDASQDIPPWVPIALTLLALPGGLGTARMAAAEFIEADSLRPELGAYPYRSARDLPEDANAGD
jgi:hypothetical protein